MCPFDGGDDHLIVFALMFARQRPHVHTTAVLCQKRSGVFGDMLAVYTPECQPTILQPFPTVPQVGELDALVGFRGLVVVIRGIEPRCAKSIVGCQQPLDIAAHRLFRTKALNALLRPFAVQFIGIRCDIPRLCCHLEK